MNILQKISPISILTVTLALLHLFLLISASPVKLTLSGELANGICTQQKKLGITNELQKPLKNRQDSLSFPNKYLCFERENSEFYPKLCNASTGSAGDDDGSRIFGGADAYFGQFPWHAGILRRTKQGQLVYHCGAVIISEHFIMTSTTCLKNALLFGDKNDLSVIAGVLNRETWTDGQEGAQNRYIGMINYHDQYNEGFTDRYDAAVVRLKVQLTITRTVQAIFIADPNYWSQDNGENLIVSGWGQTGNFGEASKTLRYINVRTMSNAVCLEALKLETGLSYPLIDVQFCIGGLKKWGGPCRLDSGDPVIVHNGADNRWELVGLVGKLPKTCEEPRTVVLTHVPKFYNWINDIIDLTK